MTSSVVVDAAEYEKYLLFRNSQVAKPASLSETVTSSSRKPGINVRGYCRVSTEEQLKGHSLESQKAEIERIVKAREWNLIEIYTDEAKSGGNVDRPGLQRLLKDVKPREYIMTYTVSRLGRNILDSINNCFRLRDFGVYIYTTQEHLDTNTASGRIMFMVLASIAAEEREKNNAVVSDSMNNMIAAGHLRSRPCFGQLFIDKNLPYGPHQGELECVAEMKRLLSETSWWTPSRLARHLNGQDQSGRPIPGEVNEFYKKIKANDQDERFKRIKAGRNEWQMFDATKVKRILIQYGLMDPKPISANINPAPNRLKLLVRNNQGTITLPTISSPEIEPPPLITPIKPPNFNTPSSEPLTVRFTTESP
jgi:DNA invertase Pin-like site-specific DNA recombinase